MSLFPSISLYHFRFLFVWRVRRTFFPPEYIVFFCLVTTGWIFDISLYENSINQSKHIANAYQQYMFKFKTREEDPSLMSAFQKRNFKLLADLVKQGISHFEKHGSG